MCLVLILRSLYVTSNKASFNFQNRPHLTIWVQMSTCTQNCAWRFLKKKKRLCKQSKMNTRRRVQNVHKRVWWHTFQCFSPVALGHVDAKILKIMRNKPTKKLWLYPNWVYILKNKLIFYIYIYSKMCIYLTWSMFKGTQNWVYTQKRVFNNKSKTD